MSTCINMVICEYMSDMRTYANIYPCIRLKEHTRVCICCIYVCVCMYVCRNMCIFADMSIYGNIDRYIFLYAGTYIYIGNTKIWYILGASIYVYMYIEIYAGVRVSMHMYISQHMLGWRTIFIQGRCILA